MDNFGYYHPRNRVSNDFYNPQGTIQTEGPSSQVNKDFAYHLRMNSFLSQPETEKGGFESYELQIPMTDVREALQALLSMMEGEFLPFLRHYSPNNTTRMFSGIPLDHAYISTTMNKNAAVIDRNTNFDLVLIHTKTRKEFGLTRNKRVLIGTKQNDLVAFANEAVSAIRRSFSEKIETIYTYANSTAALQFGYFRDEIIW